MKNDSFNVGDGGTALGVTNSSVLTVWDLLQRTNARAKDGALWLNYSSTTKTLAKSVFVDLNSEGGIG